MGNLHALEALLVVLVMFGGVAFVTIYSEPAPGDWSAREASLERKGWDALYIARDHLLEGGVCVGENMLDQLVIDGVRNVNTSWAKWKPKFFPPGYQATTYFDNGEALMPLYDEGDFRGVGQSIHYDPNLTYSLSTPTVSTVSGVEDLPLDTATLRNGRLVKARGEALQYQLTMTSLATGDSQRHAWGLTALINNSIPAYERQFAQNITWKEGTARVLTRDLSARESIGSDSIPLILSLDSGRSPDSAPSTLPVGLRAHVRLPTGWHSPAVEGTRWSMSTSQETGGISLTFTLAESVAQSDVRFTAYADETTRPFDVIHARLSNGSLGESSLLVKYTGTTPQRDLPRLVYPTTPYPIRNGSSAIFGVAFANGGTDTSVTSLDITIPGGYDLGRHDGLGAPLFDPTKEPKRVDNRPEANWPVADWEVVDARHLRWTGQRNVSALGVEYWLVEAWIAPDSNTAATSLEAIKWSGPNASALFSNEYNLTSSRWSASPGIIEHRVPPAPALDPAAGYPTAVREHKLQTITQDGKRPINGTTAYRVLPTASDVASIQSALSNSSLRVAKRMIPAGTVAEVRADIESLASTISALGVSDTTLRYELYAPGTAACPVVSRTQAFETLPTPAPVDAIVWDGGTAIPSAFVAFADGRVYRLADAPTSVAWSTPYDGTNARLAGGKIGTTSTLFVATSNGTVHALDPTTGGELWRVKFGASQLGTPTLLHYNQTREELLVGTTLGKLARLDANTRLWKTPLTVGDGSIRQIAQAADGATYALADDDLVRFDADYAETRSHTSVLPMRGFARTRDSLLIAHEQSYVRHDPTTLAWISAHGIPHDATQRIALATSGDANADGHQDLILAAKSTNLYRVDGDTHAWLVLGSGTGANFGVGLVESDAMPQQLECRPLSQEYFAPVTCGVPIHLGGPQKLATAPGLTAMAFDNEQGLGVLVVGPAGEQLWIEPAGDRTTALAAGAWGAGARALLGTASGRAILIDAATGTTAWTNTPSERVGVFSIYQPVPAGGFYGTHLARISISWTDAAKPQTATLTEWFEVVGHDGKPVDAPKYKLITIMQDGAYPIEWSPIPDS